MNNLIGNGEQIANLSKIIKNQTISHAYLFCGIDGIGKFLYAKEFAKAILCLNPSSTYCDKCEHCVKFAESPDFVIIEPENGLIKVESIRHLSDNIMLKPILSNRRCFIIRDADMMNDSAQNALLKILEEPPEYATIILTAQNKNKILGTIRSRCVTIDFNPLNQTELSQIFSSNQLSDDVLIYANGSAGKLQSLLTKDYIELISNFEKAISLADLIDMNNMLSEIKKIKTIKEEINQILDLIIIKLSKDLKNDSYKKARKIYIIEQTRNSLLKNANFDTALDYMMVQLWEINKR